MGVLISPLRFQDREKEREREREIDKEEPTSTYTYTSLSSWGGESLKALRKTHVVKRNR